ncbi:glycosyltransferase family 39 protein [Enhygromyxa salina]|uniref:Uncharacterized protein n=1 Tax=Enhygromyxa salina TaxID=215803 RepID=A0A2S9YQ96_9BACT|nr:glycosyltransferase family 39 protein [Enhygromyxa salina]PRQ07250.1 hypothetical protein ENSA7_29580 [Enhygromyxa salina]
MTLRPAVRMARLVRRVGLVSLLGASVGCGTPNRSAERAPETAASADPDEVTVGRWRGQIVEHHAQFVRYSFAEPGQPAQPGMVVELTRRRPEHGTEFGTEALAVQAAPGGQVTPELLQAVTAWLRADGPGPEQLFAAPAQAQPAAASPALEAPARVRSLGWGLIAAWLVAALGSLVPGVRGAAHQVASPGTNRWPATVGVLLLVTVAVVGLRLTFAAPSPLDDDALNDIGMGLACAAGDPCLHGATASFGGFEHGTLFPRLLGLLLSLGLTITSVQTVLIVLSAVAVAVTFEAGRRLLGARDGALAGALAAVGLLGLQLTELASTGDILWNPAAMALPAALTQVALLRGAVTGRSGWLLLAGLFAGVAYEVHLSGLALWPGLVIVAAATKPAQPAAADSRLRELAARLVWLPALAGAAGVTMVVSPASAKANALAVAEHVGWIACAGALAASVAVGSLLRWRQGQDPIALALGLPIVILAGTLAAAAGFVEALPLRYLAPAFPAVALGAGWLGAAALARISAARVRVVAAGLTVGLVLAVTLPGYLERMAVDRDRWTYADLDMLATFLRERGVAAEDLHHAVRGARCGSQSHGDRGQRLAELVIGGLRARAGLAVSPPAPADSAVPPAWLIAKLRNDDLPQLPDGASTLPSGGSHTIVLVPYQPILDLAGIRYCTRFERGEDRCVPATPLPANPAARQLLPRHRHATQPESGRAAPVAYYYELPLRWPADASAERRATLQLDARSSSSAWRFVNVQGEVGLAGQSFPTTTLEVTLAPGARAVVTLVGADALPGDGPPSPDSWWPALIEVPADPQLQAVFLAPSSATD